MEQDRRRNPHGEHAIEIFSFADVPQEVHGRHTVSETT